MKHQELFIEHYEPFIQSGIAIKYYCQQHHLDYNKFRKWRILHEKTNNLPITYRPRPDKRVRKGIVPLEIISDTLTMQSKVSSNINLNMRLPQGIDIHVENITPHDLLFLIRGL